MSDVADALREVPYFAGLDGSTIDELQGDSEVIDLDSGIEIISEGTLSDDMYVVLEGTLEVTKKHPHKTITVAQRGPGEVIGEIAILESRPRTATVTTKTPAKLLRTPASAVEKLLNDPAVIRKMFHTLTVRLREDEAAVRRDEQLASLGRMAAQLMHELNNPAAAVGRTSELLHDVYTKLGLAALAVIGVDATLPDPAPVAMGALAKADATDELSDFFRDLGADDPYGDLAAALANSGVTASSLKTYTESFDAEAIPHVVEWLGLRSQAAEMLGEISAGARRISELVAVVKSYTFLDQAPLQTINPTDGIQDTLLILKHELKSVDVEIDLAPDLHKIEAPGRNLNQVWANLIENAVDAMDGSGTIRITGRNIGDQVVIEVSDTGSGIAPGTIDLIFDPFFTTKEPGKGTGLGLHTVHNTVTRAGGTIDVDSTEGGTTFRISFPAVGGGND